MDTFVSLVLIFQERSLDNRIYCKNDSKTFIIFDIMIFFKYIIRVSGSKKCQGCQEAHVAGEEEPLSFPNETKREKVPTAVFLVSTILCPS